MLSGHLLDPMDLPGAFRYARAAAAVEVSFTGETVTTIDGEQRWVTLCDAETEIDVSDVADALRSLAERHVPPGALDLAPDYVRSLLDPEGRLRADRPLPIRFLPHALQTTVRAAERILFDHTHRTVAVARWRLDIPGPHQPLIPKARYWRPHDEWQPLPFYVPPPQYLTFGGSLGEQHRPEIEACVAAGGTEPLAQEFFREASVQRYQNPRSALALAVVAVEAGLLEGIGRLPNTPAWARGQGQTPPFRELLNYLPRVAALRPLGAAPLTPPESLLAALRSAQRHRNDLMHRGIFGLSEEQLDEILDAVRNLLLLLDFYQGHVWSLERIHSPVLSDMAKALGMAGPGDLLRAVWQVTGYRPSS